MNDSNAAPHKKPANRRMQPIHITVRADQLARVDYLAENRHDGFRSACIRRLLDLGLEAEEAGAP